jgi:hypothetical protein
VLESRVLGGKFGSKCQQQKKVTGVDRSLKIYQHYAVSELSIEGDRQERIMQNGIKKKEILTP